MPFADADGVRIYYEAHGDGPAVLFAHGAGGHHAIWWQQIPHFRDRYRVLALDFPGFGKSDSDRSDYDVHEYPAAILAVLDDAGVDQAVLVGQSLGSPPSLRVAASHPERVAGVVVSHSVGGIDHEEVHAMMRADRAEAEKLPVIDRLLRKSFQASHPEMVFLFQQMGSFNAARVPDLRNVWVGLTSIEEVRAAIAAGVQVTFLAGSDDAVIRPATYARLQELLPEAHYDLIDDAPHSMYWEAPEMFNAAIERALEAAYQPSTV
ncbi:MAG TPA: alpha/beta hydrolase [Solirubrobacteraceae bacterium]|nr:alpha/beta hydrolase [Solirubrobacteraceae bacterium]